MGSFLVTLLTDPGGFKFYKENQKGVINTNNVNPREIPFGNDRPGGGSSNQPYIKKGLINDSLNPTLYNDFILRGGILAPLSAAEDVVRLTKYFADIKNPKGLLFTAKQNLLSRTGTKTESSKGIGYAGGTLNEGAYTPLSTLAEAGIIFTGGHLNKQGIDPTGLIPGLGIITYQDAIKQNQFNRSPKLQLENNRLISLTSAITNDKGVGLSYVKGYSLNAPGNDVLLSYTGGAGSDLGIGKTNIKFATSNNNTVLKSILNVSSNVSLSGLDKTQTSLFSTWNYQQLSEVPLNLDATTADDFRLKLNPDAEGLQNTFLSATPGYKDSNNIEVKFGLSNPGSRNRNRSNYQQGSILQGQTVSEPVDKINAYPIYKSEFKDGSRYSSEDDLKDMVEFSIAILNNDDQNPSIYDENDNVIGTKSNLSYRKYMHFRSFIDNISDAYTADWSGINYMGRAEKLYKYKGFDRKISLAFTVVAQSMNELTVMYDKLNFLASSLAPEYLDSLTSGYMAGNIAYITLGDYINDQPGIITSLNFDIPEDSPWEIERNQGSRRQLPHMIKVSLDFTPIHKFRPSKQTWTNDFSISGEGISTSVLLEDPGNQRYIDPNNTYNASNDRKLPYLKPGPIPLKGNPNQNLITNPDFVPPQTSNNFNDFTQNNITQG
jgi:hypothetical protein